MNDPQSTKHQARAVSANADARRVADLVHELHTPLHALRASLELLESPDASPAQTRHLTTARAAADALQALTAGLLDGKLPPIVTPPQPVCARGLVSEALLLLEHAALARGITLDRRGLEGAGMTEAACLGDGPRLRQVLINLVSNAIKFSPRDGHVVVRAATCSARPDPLGGESPAPGTLLFFSVQDAGPGIPASKRARLFQRDSRLELGDNDPPGHGLGLAISRQIITPMCGLLAHADAPGGGSIFWCVVPLAATTPTTPTPVADSEDLSMFAEALLRSTCDQARAALLARIHAHIDAHSENSDTSPARHAGTHDSSRSSSRELAGDLPRAGSLAGLSLLVVEDDDVSRAVTGELLRRAGASCVMVGDVTSAMRLITQPGDEAGTSTPPFHAVLMDRNLAPSQSQERGAIIDGVAAARAIRVWESCTDTRHTPIIAITGDTTRAARQECLSAGMDAVVAKPFDLAQIVAAITSVTSRTLPQDQPAAPAIDLAQLGNRCLHDAAFEARLIDLFLNGLDARLAELTSALAAGEHERMRQQAHALKGAASNIAADQLRTLAQQLEDLGRTGELGQAEGLLARVTHEARACRQTLEAHASRIALGPAQRAST